MTLKDKGCYILLYLHQREPFNDLFIQHDSCSSLQHTSCNDHYKTPAQLRWQLMVQIKQLINVNVWKTQQKRNSGSMRKSCRNLGKRSENFTICSRVLFPYSVHNYSSAQRLFRLHTWFKPLDETAKSICIMRYIAPHVSSPSCNWFYVTRRHLLVCCKRHSINLHWNVLPSICWICRVIYLVEYLLNWKLTYCWEKNFYGTIKLASIDIVE